MVFLCGEELVCFFTYIRLLFMSFFQKGFEVTKKVFRIDSE